MVEMTVNGMHCAPCARAVTAAVRRVDPVANVRIDLDRKHVSIDSYSDLGAIEAAIKDSGYQVELAA